MEANRPTMESSATSNGTTTSSTNGHCNGVPGKATPDPFTYRLYPTRLDRLIWFIMLFTLAPIKMILTFIFVVLAWIPARISIIGLPLMADKPFSRWRLVFKNMACFFALCSGYTAGVMCRTIKGKQASSKEAPILVVAPHAAFADTLVGFEAGLTGVVSVIDNVYIPFMGAIFRAGQSVFLDRKDPQSRVKVAELIRARAQSTGTWSQLFIYPEGMIGNQTCLLPFKIGAFQPGVPIQPVTVQYPNRLDVTSWLDTGPSLAAMATLLAANPITKQVIEFHPVYTPSDEEKANPELFAENVRSLMCRYLDVPKTELGYKDIKERIKRTRPKRGVLHMWYNILVRGYIDMPDNDKEHLT